jgi:hypothetical protein
MIDFSTPVRVTHHGIETEEDNEATPVNKSGLDQTDDFFGVKPKLSTLALPAPRTPAKMSSSEKQSTFLKPPASRAELNSDEPKRTQSLTSLKRSKSGLSDKLTKSQIDDKSTKKKGQGKEKVEHNFCIAEEPLDDGFCNIFTACVIKRFLLYWQSPKFFIFDVVLPAILLSIGCAGTKFDTFARAESRILGPERVSIEPEMMIIDN